MGNNRNCTVLGLDPGFVATGWAVLRAGQIIAVGCMRTKPSTRKKGLRVADDDVQRCQQLARTLSGIIRAHGVRGIVAELPSGGAQGARANRCMGLVTGALAAVVELGQLPTEFVTPGDVKLATAGTRDASKKAVEAAVLARWPDAPLPKVKSEREHISDALASFLAAEHGSLVRVLNDSVSP